MKIISTEETRPPNLVGIPPLNNFKSLIASGLKTEKNLNKCDELKIMASSQRIRYWSAAPPRTLNPEAPSPVFVTPGSNNIDLMILASPRITGIFL